MEGSIDKSLMILGNVINKLSESSKPSKHIRSLQPALMRRLALYAL
ncbi:unnamed protein product [Brassica rapa subsp. trilocularis]